MDAAGVVAGIISAVFAVPAVVYAALSYHKRHQRPSWFGRRRTGRGRIFISYRRAEAAYPAGWLYDKLAGHFGPDQVFKDVDSIELGDDYREVIAEAVGACEVLLALIGPRWLTITGEDGRPRLENQNDILRLELEAALARDLRIIPILIEGARMPSAAQLPPTLAPLAARQALELNPSRFGSDTRRLLGVLEQTLAQVPTRQAPGRTTNRPFGQKGGEDVARSQSKGVPSPPYQSPLGGVREPVPGTVSQFDQPRKARPLGSSRRQTGAVSLGDKLSVTPSPQNVGGSNGLTPSVGPSNGARSLITRRRGLVPIPVAVIRTLLPIAVVVLALFVLTAVIQRASMSPNDRWANPLITTIEVGHEPHDVAVGQDAVWVTHPSAERVSRIDPATNEIVASIAVHDDPDLVAVGQDAVWVTNSSPWPSLTWNVARIDPATNEISATIQVDGGADLIAVGQDAVWVASVTGTVSRIDPATNQVTVTIGVGTSLRGLAVGQGGVWVTDSDTGWVYRIDPVTYDVEFFFSEPSPHDVAAGHDAVWVAESLSGVVFQVDLVTNDAEGIRINGGGADQVSVGRDAVWVTSANGTVYQIDPATRKVSEGIEVGHETSRLAVGEDTVWAAIGGTKSVSRIDT